MYKIDFASVPYSEEPVHIKIALIDINGIAFKILLNPTDQKRCLRLIVRTNHLDALDKSFSLVPTHIHESQTVANIISARLLEEAGALNTNVRYDGNNKFALNAEREGLHYHILGRFNNYTNILDVYQINYELGTKGDIPLGTGKLPLSKDPEENIALLSSLSDKLRKILLDLLSNAEFSEKVKLIE